MVSIDNIRQAFSKGSIAITGSGISIFYQNKDQWVTQEIRADSIGVISEMLSKFDRMVIQCIAGKMIKISFIKSLDGQEMVLYPPIEEEMSIDELRDLMELSDDPSVEQSRDEFFNFFIGTCLDDHDEVLEKVREFIEIKSGNSNAVSGPVIDRWRELQQCVLSFAGCFGFDSECCDPKGQSNGYVEVFYPDGYDKPIRVSGKSKELLLQALHVCQLLSLEFDVADGFLNMIFFN